MSNTIEVPPAVDDTLDPDEPTFAFDVTEETTICFGTADPAGSFPQLENKTFTWDADTLHEYSTPSTEGATLPYNTSAPGTACSPSGLGDIGHTISVGQGGMGGGTAKKAPARKAAKTSAAKPATKSKPKKAAKKTAKKAAKKAVKKPAKKAAKKAKKAAKKSKAKGKPKKGGRSRR